ncbi:MAG TPA: hypothetical protein VGJ21_14365 [Terracidiphilus sp.]|jgi:hypothetical protein
MNETAELSLAIQGLYKIFDRYPRPTKIEYCPCGCTKPDEVSGLLAVPLKDLKFSSLENYSFSAMSTQGSVEDFKYFLPRLFEGIVQEPYGYDPEILFGKLRYGSWLTWDFGEILALRRYLEALWRSGLRSYPIDREIPAFGEIETLLASLATTGDQLERYLAIWSEKRDTAANRHFIQFVTMYGSDFAGGKSLSFGFWSNLPGQSKALRDWILKPDSLDRVARFKELLPLDGYEHLFNPAFQVLQAELAAIRS